MLIMDEEVALMIASVTGNRASETEF